MGAPILLTGRIGILVMKLASIILTSIALVAVALTGLSYGSSSITQVSDGCCVSSHPQVKNNYVVWQSYVGGNWEIFLYDIAAGTTSQITENSYNDVTPRTDGEYVVWVAHHRTGGEIFVYSIGDPVPVSDANAITSDDCVDHSPEIADGWIAWASHGVTQSIEPGEIVLYEVESGVLKQITNNDRHDDFPRINGNEVIWVRTDHTGATTKYLYELSSGPAYELSEGYVWNDAYQADGSMTVLSRHDGHDREILLFDGDSKNYLHITDNGIEDRSPTISRNHVVWVAEGKVFLTDLLDYIAATAATNIRNTAFTANWNGLPLTCSYHLDVSTLEDFRSYVSRYRDLDVGNGNSYVVTGLRPNITYYYRVRAVLSNAIGDSSNTVMVKTATAQPNLAGVLFLLLSSDAGSSTFKFSR